jgi:uncharacterized protein (TIGR03000 family)
MKRNARVMSWAVCVVLLALLAPGLRGQAGKEAKPGKDAKPATVVVKCYDDAELDFDGTKTKQTGAQRRFTTPALEPGKKYYYVVTAKWEPNNYTKITRKRKIYVEPGKETVLDMNKEDRNQPDDIVIRYVPTPQEVVDAMLKLGRVGKNDVVYDLGCGDGRIVVTAVSKFGAKQGVGVDLDPKRIKESKENAKNAKVEDRVEFRLGDVMKIADLEKATVVTLYLADELNEQLRPILQKRLKPGSRIVSHRFLMGDWKPEKTETLDVDGEEYKIHLWTIKGAPDKDKGKEEEKDKEKDKEKKKEDE